MKPYITHRQLFFLFLTGSLWLLISCGYLQLNPPPDVRASEDPTDKSAWLAAASNMLAAAGYGYGHDAQARAERIYKQMTEHFGTTREGWTDAALQWWIGSSHNEWPENPYKWVTIIGNKEPSRPWADPRGTAIIGNLLREGNIVAASISWPTPGETGSGIGGHVLNCWGDDRGEKKSEDMLPGHLRVTDCYRNKGGIIQTYPVEAFLPETPDGSSSRGWIIDYDDNQPFIKHLILLSKVTRPDTARRAYLSQTIMFLLNEMENRADKLYLDFSSDGPMLSFRGDVTTSHDQRTSYTVSQDHNGWMIRNEWGFSRNELESGTPYRLNLESIGRWDAWTGITGGYLMDKQGNNRMEIPGISCRISGKAPGPRYQSTSATGGYYIISCQFHRTDSLDTPLEGSFNAIFYKQYPPGINPEQPVFDVFAPEGLVLGRIKAGHSYSLLSQTGLQEFSTWHLNTDLGHTFTGDTLSIPFNMIGLLPYPEGENYAKRVVER